MDERIRLLATVARTPSSNGGEAKPPGGRSIVTLAAAAYGSRPTKDTTIPTGFDPFAAALFESLVEGAFLVATADGVFDEEEQRTFERIVTAVANGAVPQTHVSDLVSDLEAQLAEDGLDRRIERLAHGVQREEQGFELLRIAALVALASEAVSDVERDVMRKLARASHLQDDAVDRAISEVETAMAGVVI